MFKHLFTSIVVIMLEWSVLAGNIWLWGLSRCFLKNEFEQDLWLISWRWWWCWNYDDDADKAQSPHRSSRWTLIQVHELLLEPLGNLLDTPPSQQSEEIWEFILVEPIISQCMLLSQQSEKFSLQDLANLHDARGYLCSQDDSWRKLPTQQLTNKSWGQRGAGLRKVFSPQNLDIFFLHCECSRFI